MRWNLAAALVLVGLALGLASGSVAFATSYTGIARVLGPGLGEIGSAQGSGVVSAEDSFVSDRIGYFAQAVGQASDGFLTGYASVRIESDESGIGGSLSAKGGGQLTLTDLIVTRLPGFEDLPDTVEATAQFAFDPTSDFGLIDNLSGGLNGNLNFSSLTPSAANPLIASTREVPVDVPLQLNLSVQIVARIESDPGTQASGFATQLAGTEAILLPEGYVANSTDGRIVDNVYLGPFTPAVGGVVGDYNFDGQVDAADYTVWRDRSDAGLPLPNDTTPDSVTIADYDVWRTNYGGPAAAAHSVPEPVGVATALFLIAGWLGTQRSGAPANHRALSNC